MDAEKRALKTYKFKEIYREQFKDGSDKCTLAVAILDDGSFSFVMARDSFIGKMKHVQFHIDQKHAKELARLILQVV